MLGRGARGRAGVGRDAGRAGAGGCSRRGGRDGSARSFTTAGALREVVPPPYRLGVSNPDPYRLFADRGARLAVVFLIEDPGSR